MFDEQTAAAVATESTEAPAPAADSGSEQVTEAQPPATPQGDEQGAGQEAEAAEGTPGAEEAPKELPAELVERAKALKFSDEEIAAFKDPEMLRTVLTAQRRNLMDFYERQEAAAAQQQAPTQPPQPQAPIPQTPAAEAFAFKMNFDEMADGMGDDLNGLHKFHSSQAQALRQELQQLRAQVQDRESREQIQAFDRTVDGLGPEWKETFGVGQPAPGSEQHRNRDILWRAKWRAARVTEATGERMTEEEVLREALAIKFPKRVEEKVRKDLQAKITKRATQIIPRGSNRETAMPFSKETTLRGIKADQEAYFGKR